MNVFRIYPHNGGLVNRREFQSVVPVVVVAAAAAYSDYNKYDDLCITNNHYSCHQTFITPKHSKDYSKKHSVNITKPRK